MNQEILLTPAQIDFLKTAIDSFSPDDWKTQLAGHAGSSRYFIRLSKNEKSYILIIWDSRDEDWDRFIDMQHDISTHLPYLPAIYKKDNLHGIILEEDLGNITLKKYCIDNADDIAAVMSKYRDVLDALREWQQLDISVSQSVTSRAMDLDTFLWETWYFEKFCVTDYCACEIHLNKKWEKERNALAQEVALLPRVYIHRDFQSENVMITDDKVRFVDFQGARLGPPEYDVASLLLDPYVNILSQEHFISLLEYYHKISDSHDRERIFYLCAAQRLMQALGAYGNLSLHKGKEWFKEYIPVALERLIGVLQKLPEFDHALLIAQSCLYAVMKNKTAPPVQP